MLFNVASHWYIEQVLVVLAAVLALIVCLAALSASRDPVNRARVERFARLHALPITVSNGNQAIRYLAVTRRWRTAGLIGGLVVSGGWTLPDGRVGGDSLAMFSGWFVGALVAEVRVARVPFGPRRAASLMPRSPAAYLSRAARALLPAATALSLAVGAATAIAALTGHEVHRVAALAWLVVTLTTAAAVHAMRRYILHRPQPVAPPDVTAADDAIRSRSLHVLSGAGAALVAYCVLGQVDALRPVLDGSAWPLPVLVLLAGVVGPLAGVAVAISRWPVNRRVAVPARRTS
jgi:hypothetical protein